MIDSPPFSTWVQKNRTTIFGSAAVLSCLTPDIIQTRTRSFASQPFDWFAFVGGTMGLAGVNVKQERSRLRAQERPQRRASRAM